MFFNARAEFLVVAVAATFSIGSRPFAGDRLLKQNAAVAAVLLVRFQLDQEVAILYQLF
jgi:hypothetical protein